MIDEVHRLTQLYETEARTIVDTLMRQVRQFGALYTATQNYSDIPDALRNQFATQLTFNTTSETGFGGDTQDRFRLCLDSEGASPAPVHRPHLSGGERWHSPDLQGGQGRASRAADAVRRARQRIRQKADATTTRADTGHTEEEPIHQTDRATHRDGG